MNLGSRKAMILSVLVRPMRRDGINTHRGTKPPLQLKLPPKTLLLRAMQPIPLLLPQLTLEQQWRRTSKPNHNRNPRRATEPVIPSEHQPTLQLLVKEGTTGIHLLGLWEVLLLVVLLLVVVVGTLSAHYHRPRRNKAISMTTRMRQQLVQIHSLPPLLPLRTTMASLHPKLLKVQGLIRLLLMLLLMLLQMLVLVLVPQALIHSRQAAQKEQEVILSLLQQMNQTHRCHMLLLLLQMLLLPKLMEMLLLLPTLSHPRQPPTPLQTRSLVRQMCPQPQMKARILLLLRLLVQCP
mmetsp:Transcript_10047/g.19849  ORF Transcript_10047/g.19849 Transcript_10047/m.19849 type:complete len:294 (+) Transcript_10047:2361-3242(+)